MFIKLRSQFKFLRRYGYHIQLLFLLFILSCNNNYQVDKIEGKRLEINDSLITNNAIDDFIKPYRQSLNQTLDSVISYAPRTLSKTDGELNTALGNLMADAVFEECNPIFKGRTGKEIDFVLLNHGGIRAIIPEGHVTMRTAYKVMPFENAVVVVALKGSQINEMLDYLSKAKRAHPLSSQIEIKMTREYQIISVFINDLEIEDSKVYYVATNDYLYNGGDRMTFFQPNDSLYILDYKIRNVLIDHFSKMDTLRAKRDMRFTREKS